MKKLLLALFLVFTLPLSAEEQPAVPTADEQAAALINAQEWFRLEACYPEIRDELSPFVRLLCEASLGSHFNRLPESCNAIGTLLNDYQQELFADPAPGTIIPLETSNRAITGYIRQKPGSRKGFAILGNSDMNNPQPLTLPHSSATTDLISGQPLPEILRPAQVVAYKI